MLGYMTEGRLAKVIAVAAVFSDPAVYGGGARGCLGMCVPPEPTIVLIEDARPEDATEGAAHDQAMERAADRLLLAGKIVKRAGGPPCNDGCKDIDEALGKHPVEELRAWITNAEPVQLSLDGHARKCARIKDPLQQGRAITDVIEQHGLRRSGLTKAFRAQVQKYGGHGDSDEDEASELAGQEITLQNVLPWPTEVDGAAVLNEIKTCIGAHVVMSSEQATLAVALWVLHCHAHAAANHSPRLVLRSPTKGCGKSTLRRALSRLVPRAFEAVDITGPTLFRPIGQWSPITVFVDEANEINWLNARDLIAVIDSGHCRDDPGRAALRRSRPRSADVSGMGAAVHRADRVSAGADRRALDHHRDAQEAARDRGAAAAAARSRRSRCRTGAQGRALGNRPPDRSRTR